MDRMESAAREMGSEMLQTEALRGWLATPARVPEVAEGEVGADAPAAVAASGLSTAAHDAVTSDSSAAVDDAAAALPEKKSLGGSVVLQPDVLSRVSRDGDPMVVLVAGEAESGGAGGAPREVVNLDNLVRQALTEALDDPTWLSVR
jgi:ABC-type Na+ efflux pump permease subunit